MIPVPSGVQVWLASGHTDMRKGFDGLALLVQETLRRNPHNGHLFVFRGRRGSLIKVLGTTARECACLRSGWSAVVSSGHRVLRARAPNER
jgi:transposase